MRKRVASPKLGRVTRSYFEVRLVFTLCEIHPRNYVHRGHGLCNLGPKFVELLKQTK